MVSKIEPWLSCKQRKLLYYLSNTLLFLKSVGILFLNMSTYGLEIREIFQHIYERL